MNTQSDFQPCVLDALVGYLQLVSSTGDIPKNMCMVELLVVKRTIGMSCFVTVCCKQVVRSIITLKHPFYRVYPDYFVNFTVQICSI